MRIKFNIKKPLQKQKKGVRYAIQDQENAFCVQWTTNAN
jgi:hypothetical protein